MARTVPIKVELDYDKLAEAIVSALRPQTVTVTVQVDEKAADAVQRALRSIEARRLA